MAWVASTIADGGVRVPLTLRAVRNGARTARPDGKRVLRAQTARLVRAYMESVVEVGTGGAAKIGGVRVAGKTGTAELRDTTTPDCTPAPEVECPPVAAERPDRHRRVVRRLRPRPTSRGSRSAVLLIANGAGGDTAAPVARQVLHGEPQGDGLTPRRDARQTSRLTRPVCLGNLRPSIFSSSGRLLSPVSVSLKSRIAPCAGLSKAGESSSG